jgi:hypothetical protein
MIPRREDSGRTGGVVWQLHIISGAGGKTMGAMDMDANNVLFVEGLTVSRSSCVDG